MTQIFVVVAYAFEGGWNIGAFSTRGLANDAMRVWVDRHHKQELALATHWQEEVPEDDRYQEKRDDKGALYFENDHDDGLRVDVLEFDAPCQFDVIEWLAALQE